MAHWNTAPGAIMSSSLPATIDHPTIELHWTGGLRFESGRPQGPRVKVDGDGTTAPNPFDLLLAAIASCACVDVVTILEKQRTPPQTLEVRIEALRVDATPRRLAAATLHFRIAAAGTTIEKANRAVELAVTRYCSVRSSLDPATEVRWTVELAD